MNQEITTEAVKGWWRWPLVPVASIAAATLGAIAVATFQGIAVELQDDYARDGWFHLYLYPVVPAAMFGYLLAETALHIAPGAKLVSGLVMTGIMDAALVSLTAIAWIADGVPRNDAIQMTTGALAAVGAAVVVLIKFRKHSRT